MFTLSSVTGSLSLPSFFLCTKTCCFSLYFPCPVLTHTFTTWGVKERTVFPLSQWARSHWVNSQLLCVETCQLPDCTTFWNIHFNPKPCLINGSSSQTNTAGYSALQHSRPNFGKDLHEVKSCCHVWLSSTCWPSQIFIFFACTYSFTQDAASPPFLVVKHYLKAYQYELRRLVKPANLSTQLWCCIIFDLSVICFAALTTAAVSFSNLSGPELTAFITLTEQTWTFRSAVTAGFGCICLCARQMREHQRL